MKTQEFLAYVKLAREHGLKRVRVGELEFELGPSPAPPAPKRAAKKNAAPRPPKRDPLFDAVE